MRMGAERIVRCLVSMHRGYGLPEVMPWAVGGRPPWQ